MGIKTIPLRSIEEKVDNIYEAVVVMSGQAKRVLDERIVQESIKDAEEEDYGVFDEVEEKSPEDYIELEKILPLKQMTKEEYVSNALSNRFPDFHKKLLKEHKMLGVEMEIL